MTNPKTIATLPIIRYFLFLLPCLYRSLNWKLFSVLDRLWALDSLVIFCAYSMFGSFFLSSLCIVGAFKYWSSKSNSCLLYLKHDVPFIQNAKNNAEILLWK